MQRDFLLNDISDVSMQQYSKNVISKLEGLNKAILRLLGQCQSQIQKFEEQFIQNSFQVSNDEQRNLVMKNQQQQIQTLIMRLFYKCSKFEKIVALSIICTKQKQQVELNKLYIKQLAQLCQDYQYDLKLIHNKNNKTGIVVNNRQIELLQEQSVHIPVFDLHKQIQYVKQLEVYKNQENYNPDHKNTVLNQNNEDNNINYQYILNEAFIDQQRIKRNVKIILGIVLSVITTIGTFFGIVIKVKLDD